MWKVRTTFSVVAVPVARKESGQVVILAHLGSAHNDAEQGILRDRARGTVAGGQGALDTEVAARGLPSASYPMKPWIFQSTRCRSKQPCRPNADALNHRSDANDEYSWEEQSVLFD